MNANAIFTPDWKWGTAEGSREFDRQCDRQLTFRQKLEWLEEAESLTLSLAASRQNLIKRGRSAPFSTGH